ncbi:hypothetical protein BDN71DRAFT_1509192 [Pleurotus eryngii]|uniref:Uncharacterized protein n=1 Tax=Pleurotus eryngii TaxID=5323 RepID=A0A9P6D690_PLEER|nr:hypothetical protein BDN71DRAFT_1509192 [Pleurotus eryngii]
MSSISSISSWYASGLHGSLGYVLHGRDINCNSENGEVLERGSSRNPLDRKSMPISQSPLLRYHALAALRKSLNSAKRAVTDASAKGIIKQMRNGLTDKCMPVQRASAEVRSCRSLRYLAPNESSLPSSGDVDTIITLCVKNLDSVDQVTRRALAQPVGHLLASTQIERTVVIQEPAAKGVKKDGQALGDDPLSPAGGTSTEIKKPMFTPAEMLAHLGTHFTKTLTSSSGLAARETRVGIFDFYSALITKLGSSFVESNYALVVQYFMNDIVANLLLLKNAHANNLNAGSTLRYETLLIRNAVGILVRDVIGVRMLSEQPMMPGQVAAPSTILVVALREVAGLLQQLGKAPPPVRDAVSEPLVALLTHPSHPVRVNASWALRCFCYSTPLRLLRTILGVTDMLQRDLTSILSPAVPSDINLRALGHAYGLAALVSIVKERPLYVSYDISAKVLDMATQLLKRAGDHDLKVARVEVELLVLWRNALPKPTSKEGMATGSGRSVVEWMFLLHVRESALGAMLCFLQHNSGTLVTLDVARRIASVLGNALSVANTFVSQSVEDPSENAQMPTTANKGLSLRGREALLRRRVSQYFSALGFSGITESTQVTLLQSTVALFASPDGYAGSSMQAAIASSSGSFASVWQIGDGYAYGVTHLDIEGADTAATDMAESESRDSPFLSLAHVQLRRPILGACEHDPLSVCQSTLINTEYYIPEPAPPSTAVVDAAITLFSQLLPLQNSSSSAKIIGSMLESTRSNKFEKNLGRKAAVFVNSAVALVLALRVAGSFGTGRSRECLGSGQVTGLLSSFLKEALVDGDPVLHKARSECTARLANIAGTNFLTSQMKSLVDQVVNNRHPYGLKALRHEVEDALHVARRSPWDVINEIIYSELKTPIVFAHEVIHFDEKCSAYCETVITRYTTGKTTAVRICYFPRSSSTCDYSHILRAPR